LIFKSPNCHSKATNPQVLRPLASPSTGDDRAESRIMRKKYCTLLLFHAFTSYFKKTNLLAS